MVMEDMIMALATAMVIVIPVATTTIITVMGILLDINNLDVIGTIIVDHGVDPVIGDEIKGRPLPMGYNSSPLAKSSIWSSLNFSLVGKPLSDHPRIE
jgi:hypothetical protein